MHFLEDGYGHSWDRHRERNGAGIAQGPKLPGETCFVEDGTWVEGEHAAHEIGQLAYVARPVMSLQPIHEARIKNRHRTVCLDREFFGKVPGQKRNVFDALTKGGDGKRNNV
jgi:hypothetical protein